MSDEADLNASIVSSDMEKKHTWISEIMRPIKKQNGARIAMISIVLYSRITQIKISR